MNYSLRKRMETFRPLIVGPLAPYFAIVLISVIVLLGGKLLWFIIRGLVRLFG